MNQSGVAGVIFIIFCLILEGKPDLIWEITEKWKNREANGHWDMFVLITRSIGGVFGIVGILLLLGIVQ